MNSYFEKESNVFLFLLLLGDLAFVVVFAAYKIGWLTSPLFSIGKDLGYAEVYQYIKEYWIAALLFVLFVRRRHAIFLSWSFLFFFLLLDDSLKIHEEFGVYLANYFGLQSIFHSQAIAVGEIGAALVLGCFLFAFIGFAYLFSNHRGKQISKRLFLLVVVLAIFGVLFDFFHSSFPWGQRLWGLIEEVGEMLVMSVILWYVFALKSPPKEASSNSTSHVMSTRR
ncbi:hypothetical protein IQ266_07095 [filamentous cyanobacterium LEGE 11480]|uniref:Uncharacterized protein n=1 Tax=Romeriopsis navalis LEGE 11480 TaxID=2777977 RepID=A0A928VKQ8_9CYAN|nr:hypothetical protein [Romeriopsis navalis]MBE9029528.1 hypothetical protein [Romeriopsis navalis LEGE 11480]